MRDTSGSAVLTDAGTRRVSRQFARLFHGEVPRGPLCGDKPVEMGHITFDDEFGEICDTYLLLDYCADQPRGCGPGIGTCAACRNGGHHDQ
jgi:hypothetical protein